MRQNKIKRKISKKYEENKIVTPKSMKKNYKHV
jgi:hypothetical protein